MEKKAKDRGEIGEEPVRFEVVVACLAENPEHSQRCLVLPHSIAGCWCDNAHDEAVIVASFITGRYAAADDILTRSSSVPGTKHPLQ